MTRARLERELRRSVLLAAMPAVVLLQEKHIVAPALRAGNAIGQRRATRYSRQFTGSAK